MNKKVIKEYLKRVGDLNTRLVGKDKETFDWLIYGYNQCAKLLHEKEEQIKEQKEIIEKAINWTIKYQTEWCQEDEVIRDLKQLLDILKEASNYES